MGYGYYVLQDGREAGYTVDAVCDEPGCTEVINRGLGCICGQNPIGHKGTDEPGCGNYYCEPHKYSHECSNPECDTWSDDEMQHCSLATGHDGVHVDHEGVTFTVSSNP